MKRLNSLTLKNVRLNKKRTIVTIFGIMLSVALICAITTFVASFQETLIARARKTDGDYHLLVSRIQPEQVKYIENNVKAKEISFSQSLGYAQYATTNEDKPYVYVEQFDEMAFAKRGLQLLQGRYPENNTEIVIPSHLIINGGAKLKIGDTIELAIGKRSIEGEELTQNNPFLSGKEETENGIIPAEKETFQAEQTRNYTIVGIIDRPNFEDYSAPGYTVITKLEKQDSTKPVSASILLKDPKEAYIVEEQLDKNLKDVQIDTNTELLRWQGVMANDIANNTLMSLAVIVISIIIFTSVFVIKNSFQISITERTKQLGMLASIGATSKQIKKSVLFEGFILGAIAIPFGILLGILAIWIVILVVGELIATTSLVEDGFVMQFVISLPAILVAIGLSVITIFISCILPARKAARISPIDAIRQTEDIKMNGKKLRTSKIAKKLFGIEGDIARKNLKRSRKKYRTTIFSIFISVVLFISMSSIVEYGYRTTQVEYRTIDYNVTVRNSLLADKKQKIDYFEEIAKFPEVKEYAITREESVKIEEQNLSEEAIQVGYYDRVTIEAVGKQQYEKYVKKLGLSYEEVKDKGILYDTSIKFIYENEGKDIKRKEYNQTKLKEGDLLEFKAFNSKTGEYDLSKKIEIAKRVNTTPMGLFDDMSSIVLIVSDEYIETLNPNVEKLAIYTEQADQLEQKVLAMSLTQKGQVSNLEKAQKETSTMMIIISIFLYGFIIVISIIGMTNIFNTITTNISLRRREFAILKSVGMTDKEFNKMIRYESFLYGTKALLFGLPVGIGLSYLIYKTIGNMYEMIYHFPTIPVILSIVFVFAIIFITMQYSVNKTKKQNTIDAIRMEI